MARTRDIKPAVFDSERFGGSLSGDAFRSWVALLQLADRDGYVERRPGRLRKYTFGYHDDITVDAVYGMILELIEAGIVTEAESENGDKWLLLHNFTKHVSVHPREQSRYLAEPCPGPAGKVRDRRRRKKAEGRRQKEDRRGKKGGDIGAWFDREFWPRYPLKVAKAKAKAAAEKIPVEELPAVLDGLTAQLAWDPDYPAGLNPARDKLPHAATWINQGRWNDEPPAGATPPPIKLPLPPEPLPPVDPEEQRRGLALLRKGLEGG